MSKIEIRIDAVSDGNIPHITGQSKIERNRILCTVVPYTIKSDRYDNEAYVYDDKNTFTISIMWLPVSSQVEIAEYGERVNEMLQGVLWSDDTIREKDRIIVNGIAYTVVSVKPFPSYRLLLIERVR